MGQVQIPEGIVSTDEESQRIGQAIFKLIEEIFRTRPEGEDNGGSSVS